MSRPSIFTADAYTEICENWLNGDEFDAEFIDAVFKMYENDPEQWKMILEDNLMSHAVLTDEQVREITIGIRALVDRALTEKK